MHLTSSNKNAAFLSKAKHTRAQNYLADFGHTKLHECRAPARALPWSLAGDIGAAAGQREQQPFQAAGL